MFWYNAVALIKQCNILTKSVCWFFQNRTSPPYAVPFILVIFLQPKSCQTCYSSGYRSRKKLSLFWGRKRRFYMLQLKALCSIRIQFECYYTGLRQVFFASPQQFSVNVVPRYFWAWLTNDCNIRYLRPPWNCDKLFALNYKQLWSGDGPISTGVPYLII
jgi:hypothetical protein